MSVGSDSSQGSMLDIQAELAALRAEMQRQRAGGKGPKKDAANKDAAKIDAANKEAAPKGSPDKEAAPAEADPSGETQSHPLPAQAAKPVARDSLLDSSRSRPRDAQESPRGQQPLRSNPDDRVREADGLKSGRRHASDRPTQRDSEVRRSGPAASGAPPSASAKPAPSQGSLPSISSVSREPARSEATEEPFFPSALNPPLPLPDAAEAPQVPQNVLDMQEELSGDRGLVFHLFGAWGVSVLVHVAVLLLLGLLMLPAVLQSDPPVLEALAERPQEEVVEVLPSDLVPSDTSSTQSVQSAMSAGHATALNAEQSVPTFETAVEQGDTQVQIGALNLGSVRGTMLAVEVSDMAPGDPQAVVDGYEEAMDRITHEILTMLQKSPVLVVWLFDQSESMKDDQQEIRDRIAKVYTELGLKTSTKNGALMTAVASYGATGRVHTKTPTDSLDAIAAAIDEIPIDKTGEEQMCLALGNVLQNYEGYAKKNGRQMALILVSDESGDQQTNVSLLEPVIATARQARCRIYVLGREAVFGYPYAHYRWIHPQTGRLHLIPIDRGPETAFVEQLQTDGFQRRHDSHASGFGPFEQCRLARETGGIFFMLPSVETDLNRDEGDNRRYDLQRMRPYLPLLESRDVYAAERDGSKLRSTLWKVISDLNPYRPEIAQYIDMRLEFSPNPQTFGNQVKVELTKAEMYFKYLAAAEKAMQDLTPAREKEVYPRWQANYDLLYAQLLAYKVRLYEYGAYLTEFAKKPKEVPLRKPIPNNQFAYLQLARWDIRTRQETITGDLTRSFIDESRRRFERVIEEHPGTPWAARAESELKRGFGVELMEVYHTHDPRPRPPSPPRVLIPVPKL